MNVKKVQEQNEMTMKQNVTCLVTANDEQVRISRMKNTRVELIAVTA